MRVQGPYRQIFGQDFIHIFCRCLCTMHARRLAKPHCCGLPKRENMLGDVYDQFIVIFAREQCGHGYSSSSRTPSPRWRRGGPWGDKVRRISAQEDAAACTRSQGDPAGPISGFHVSTVPWKGRQMKTAAAQNAHGSSNSAPFSTIADM